MNLAYPAILALCRRHADRLNWSMGTLAPCFPPDETMLDQLDDVTLGVHSCRGIHDGPTAFGSDVGVFYGFAQAGRA